MTNFNATELENQASSNSFLKEYSADNAVRRYEKKTAGKGIEYLLSNVYGPIYLETIKTIQEDKKDQMPLKILEFGCGAGMNLIYLLNKLRRKDISVNAAYGTDFSIKMIQAANNEAKKFLVPEDLEKSKFIVASNENIQHELSIQCGVELNYFNGYFDLILGVNTFRYCWRNKNEIQCAQLLYNMLSRGGRVIIIDMNKNFPYYLAEFKKNILCKIKNENTENNQSIIDFFITLLKRKNNLPTLEEYVHPFRKVGFEILDEGIFNWISHSAGKLRLRVFRFLTPCLNRLFPNRAMRVLVIARKPLISNN